MSRATKATDGASGGGGAGADGGRHAPRPEQSTGVESKGSARIIAMLNQKGGVGKTTTTVNLGAALAEAGQRVCLIDLDPQAHLTLHLGIEPERIGRTMYDLLTDPECYASDVLISGARHHLDALLAETDLAAAETELANVEHRQSILRDKFGSLAEAYDFVIIDCPPSLGLLSLNALSLAKEVFVPMQAHFLALQGVGKLLETVGLVCQSINPELRVSGIILCMHEQQTTLAREIVADLDAFFIEAAAQDVPWNNCRVLRPAIRRNVKLAEAPSFGKTILDYEPTCPGANDYRLLARQVMGGDQALTTTMAALHTSATTELVASPSRSEAMIEARTVPAESATLPVPATWIAPAPPPDAPEIVTGGRKKTAAAPARPQAGL